MVFLAKSEARSAYIGDAYKEEAISIIYVIGSEQDLPEHLPFSDEIKRLPYITCEYYEGPYDSHLPCEKNGRLPAPL